MAGAIGALFLAVLGGVLTVRANEIVNPVAAPEPPPTTRTSVTEISPATPDGQTPSIPASAPAPSGPGTSAIPAYSGALGSGWSIETPTALGNDYISVVASMKPDDECNGGRAWVFRQTVKQLAPLRFEASASPWAQRNGGIPASGNYITLDVQNRNHHPVIIDRIDLKVVNYDPPNARTKVTLTGGCGGLEPAFFAAQLDGSRHIGVVTVRAVSGTDGAGRTIHAVPLPHRLDDQDPSEQWRLRLDATQCSCAVIPIVTWSSEGTTAKFEVTNHGGTWRVTSYSGATDADRVDESGRWEGYRTEK